MKPLTVKEASAQSSLSKSLIYDLCKAGRLKHFRVTARGRRGAGKILIAPEDLEELMRECRVKEAQGTEAEESLTFLK